MSTWIWDVFHRETPNQLLLFRRIVHAETAVRSGTITVAARGSFRVWVNDTVVAHHDIQSATPGADAVSIDLTPVLHDQAAGLRDQTQDPRHRTTLTLMIGVHLLGVGTHHQPRACGGLLVEGSVRDTAGTFHPLDTDDRWEVAVPPGWRQNATQASWTTGFTEWSDRTLDTEPLGWGGTVPYPDDDRPTRYERPLREHLTDLTPHRQERGWIPTAAWAQLALDAPDRAAALVAAGAVRSAGSPADHSEDTDPRYTLYRLPHERVGFVTVTVDATAPTTIDAVMGETVDRNGWPTATRQRISAVDTVTVPAGRTVHRFWHRRAFRALALVTRTPGVATVTAEFAAVTADRPRPVYTTDVERDARMHTVSLATVEVGRQDFYEDCPLREGGHYVADARLQAVFDITTTGVADTSRRSIRQFAASQDPDGMIPALTPSGTHHRIPDFTLQWVCQLDEHVRLTGDRALLTDLQSTLDRTMDWADSRWHDGHFDFRQPGWWPFIDWYAFEPEALQAALDAQYAAALRAAISLEEQTSRPSDRSRAARYSTRLDEVLTQLHPRLLHPHAAAIIACSLDTRAARDLVEPTVFDDFRPATGYFMFYLCRALIALNDATGARQRLDEYWGGMLDAGATTWWERWSQDRNVDADGQTDANRDPAAGADDSPEDDVSLCHPWSAGPILLLPMLTLGIDPLARDHEQARFPQVPTSTRTTAALHTPWGIIETV